MDIFNNKMKPLEEFNWVKIKLNHQSKVKFIRMLSGFFFHINGSTDSFTNIYTLKSMNDQSNTVKLILTWNDLQNV